MNEASEKNFFSCQTISKCNTITGPLAIPSNGITPSKTLPIIGVSIDTSYMNSPSIKVNFSSNISYSTSTILDAGGATFQLSKVYDGKNKIPIKTADFFILNNGISLSTNESFGFISCEENTCPGCWDYIVEVTTTPQFTNGVDSTITISNINIFVLAVNNII